jgi:hypothetical protein
MTSKPKKDPLAILMTLPGVGKATAKKLSDAGIKTQASIAKAGQKGLIKAGLSAVMSKELLSAVTKKPTAKKTATKKPSAKKAATKKPTAKKAATKKPTAKKAATKAKSTAKKALSKAAASGRKVAEKSIKRTTGSMTVKSSKSTDGRKGKTLKVPRTVKDMPWFNKG